MNGGLEAESPPSTKKGSPIFAGDLRQWGKKNPRKWLLLWAKELSRHQGAIYELIEKVHRDNKRITYAVHEMPAWGKAGRKPMKKRTL